MFRTALTKSSPRTATSDPFFHLVDSLFDGGRDRFFTGPTMAENNRGWSPAVDIHENDGGYTLTADLPGLAKDDIEVSVEDNVLTVSGERSFTAKDEGDNGTWRRVERSYGSFSRSFTLPASVDTSKVEAHFENGVLSLVVPKDETARIRKITVS